MYTHFTEIDYYDDTEIAFPILRNETRQTDVCYALMTASLASLKLSRFTHTRFEMFLLSQELYEMFLMWAAKNPRDMGI